MRPIFKLGQTNATVWPDFKRYSLQRSESVLEYAAGKHISSLIYFAFVETIATLYRNKSICKVPNLY